MDVFITFHSEDQAIPMLDSANRWAKCNGASPSIIQTPENFEIKRRVTVDNLARGDYYILADMLCVPGENNIIELIESKIKDYPDINMFGLTEKDDKGNIFACNYPSGIRVCKKGAIEKWPQNISGDYNLEHANAAKNIMIFDDIFFVRLSQC